MIFRKLSLFFFITLMAGTGAVIRADQLPVLNIEQVVQQALNTNDNIIIARNDLRYRELDLQRLSPGNQLSLISSFSGVLNGNPPPTPYGEIAINLPLTTQLNLEAALPVNDRLAYRLNYLPFAVNEALVNAQTCYHMQWLYYRKTILDTEFDVRQKYIRLFMDIKRTQLAKAQFDLAGKIYEETKNAGDGTDSDTILIARRDFLDAEITLKNARKNEADSRAYLAQTCHNSLDGTVLVELPEISGENQQILQLKQQLNSWNIDQNFDIQINRYQLQYDQYIYQRLKNPLSSLMFSITLPNDTMQYILSAGLNLTIKNADRIEAEKQLLLIKNDEQRIEILTREFSNTKERLTRDLEIQMLILSRAVLDMEIMNHTLTAYTKQVESGQASTTDLERLKCQFLGNQISVAEAKTNLWYTLYAIKQLLASQI